MQPAGPKYDVCVSYASEDRPYVARVVAYLRDAHVQVFYDSDYQVELWGKDQYQELSDIYEKQARFCLVFISAAYAAKRWTHHELKSAQARALREPEEYILPVRLDATDLPGLLGTLGYIDATTMDAENLAGLVIAKITPRQLPTAPSTSESSADTLQVSTEVLNRLDKPDVSPSRVLFQLMLGMAVSLIYGIVAAGVVFVVDGPSAAQAFVSMYLGPFNTLLLGGLIAGTSIFVFSHQAVVPERLEATFSEDKLATTSYFAARVRYLSQVRTISFVSYLAILGFVAAKLAGIPMSGYGESFMIVALSGQWALLGYVVRKLFYGALMLKPLAALELHRVASDRRWLRPVHTFIRLAATLAVGYLYVYVRTYYDAPFLYDGLVGAGARLLLIGPAVAGSVVLCIISFYPLAVLRQRREQFVATTEALPHSGQATAARTFNKYQRHMPSLRLRDLLILVIVVLIILEVAARQQL